MLVRALAQGLDDVAFADAALPLHPTITRFDFRRMKSQVGSSSVLPLHVVESLRIEVPVEAFRASCARQTGLTDAARSRFP